jgi:hypothetical protein
MGDDELLLGLDAALILCHEFIKILNGDAFGWIFIDEVEDDALEDLRVFWVFSPFVFNSAELLWHELLLLVVITCPNIIKKTGTDDGRANRKHLRLLVGFIVDGVVCEFRKVLWG